MAYIRSKKEELTGYQASGEIRPSVDLGCDFIMVYGIDPTMPERIRQYREKGYVIHLMTGIAWGEYQEYLDGKWDGLNTTQATTEITLQGVQGLENVDNVADFFSIA